MLGCLSGATTRMGFWPAGKGTNKWGPSNKHTGMGWGTINSHTKHKVIKFPGVSRRILGRLGHTSWEQPCLHLPQFGGGVAGNKATRSGTLTTRQWQGVWALQARGWYKGWARGRG